MLTGFITLTPGLILLSVVSGTGDTKKAMFQELWSLAIYAIVVWYIIIELKLDISAAWACEHSYNIFLCYLTYKYLKKNNWCCKII